MSKAIYLRKYRRVFKSVKISTYLAEANQNHDENYLRTRAEQYALYHLKSEVSIDVTRPEVGRNPGD